MPVITKILMGQGKNKDRVYVYIDGVFCASIRQRSWIGMNLREDSVITCEELKKLENNIWMELYGRKSWELEKVRIKRVEGWFAKYIPQVKIVPIGLGADTNDYLEDIHSEQKGAPDLSIQAADSKVEIIALEVSGTERKQRTDYWVRKDKIAYIQNNYQRDIWIVLHYKLPYEKFIRLKVDPVNDYPIVIKNIKGADEHYVSFTDTSPEIRSSEFFRNYILEKIRLLNIL